MIIKASEAKIAKLQEGITEITSDNEKLMVEIARQLELLSKHAAAQEEIEGEG